MSRLKEAVLEETALWAAAGSSIGPLEDPAPGGAFYGSIQRSTFCIYRRTATSRMLRPVILGRVEATEHPGNGPCSSVELRVGPDIAAAVALTLFAAVGPVICAQLASVVEPGWLLITGGALWSMANVMLLLGFTKQETTIAVQWLRKILSPPSGN